MRQQPIPEIVILQENPPAIFHRSRVLSPLDATLTNLACVSPLDATLRRPPCKSIKPRDFKSLRIRTYEDPLGKPCRINTYKKWGVRGVASDSCEGRSGRPERHLQVPTARDERRLRAFFASPDLSGRGPTPSGGEGRTNRMLSTIARDSSQSSSIRHFFIAPTARIERPSLTEPQCGLLRMTRGAIIAFHTPARSRAQCAWGTS